jgi:PhnB protein
VVPILGAAAASQQARRDRRGRARGAALQNSFNGWDTPAAAGHQDGARRGLRGDPDSFVERAVTGGADGSADDVQDHERPWRTHRQGGFADAFGHIWLVGDRSPLNAHRPR